MILNSFCSPATFLSISSGCPVHILQSFPKLRLRERGIWRSWRYKRNCREKKNQVNERDLIHTTLLKLDQNRSRRDNQTVHNALNLLWFQGAIHPLRHWKAPVEGRRVPTTSIIITARSKPFPDSVSFHASPKAYVIAKTCLSLLHTELQERDNETVDTIKTCRSILQEQHLNLG